MIRLKISKHDTQNILLEALNGIDNFGFGTFLCDLKADEIECDKFSKEAILNAKEKSGLNGMEIWEDNRIAWGSPSPKIIMPISEISNMCETDGWLTEINAT
jgi:hypothetical protein